MPGDAWDLDHKVALINGGRHAEDNLAPALKDKLTQPPFAAVDHNLYVRPATPGTPALVAWSPAAGDTNQFMLQSPAEVNAKFPQFEAHSRLLDLVPGAVLLVANLLLRAPCVYSTDLGKVGHPKHRCW